MDPNAIQLNLTLNFDWHIVILGVIVLAFTHAIVGYISYQQGVTDKVLKRDKLK